MRIDEMTIEQLIELNHYICERIDWLRDMQNADILMDLQTGNKVAFQDKYGDDRIGIVLKKNRKTVVVMTEDREQWKISLGLIRIAKDVN
ncbi:hypothetical protein FJM67_12485 [Maribrevibacterium harenarium]|uniref:Uncharacterized protein n=1 Tax=Maribrevibacterium harenarium TaxID=2589817 RepID=A0A501WNZ5_9GAMM|nr:hypothetical protein [Maribrevibacterium harenarium]TPE49007.1 hypothetical protein FJM67_12485 [Maribrevibacterium harenarium]